MMKEEEIHVLFGVESNNSQKASRKSRIMLRDALSRAYAHQPNIFICDLINSGNVDEMIGKIVEWGECNYEGLVKVKNGVASIRDVWDYKGDFLLLDGGTLEGLIFELKTMLSKNGCLNQVRVDECLSIVVLVRNKLYDMVLYFIPMLAVQRESVRPKEGIGYMKGQHDDSISSIGISGSKVVNEIGILIKPEDIVRLVQEDCNENLLTAKHNVKYASIDAILGNVVRRERILNKSLTVSQRMEEVYAECRAMNKNPDLVDEFLNLFEPKERSM